MRRLALALLALFLLRADMFQDAGNAEQPGALNNITKAAGSFYAPAYGDCTWDATHDVGGCVNAALAAAAVAGGGTVTLPAGTYGVSTPIATGANYVGVGCNTPSGSRAASDPFNVPPPAEAGGCELKWIGAAGGRIMSFAAPNDTQFLVGARVENIRFNGNLGLAADGLYLRSTHGGQFNNLKFVGGFNGGNVVNLDIVPGEHVVPHGNQWNNFDDLKVYNWKYTSNGLKLGFFQSTTGTGANASLNSFDNLHIFTGNGATGKGIWCRGCDNNNFKTSYVSVDTGGVAIDLDIYNDNTKWFPANNNIFDHAAFGFPGGNAIARGQTTYPTCIAFRLSPDFGNCTWGNEFRRLDGSNGTPPPQIEPGAYVKYALDYGVGTNTSGAVLTSDGQRAAQTLMSVYANVQKCGNDSIAYGTWVGSHYCIENWPAQLYSNGSPTVGQQDHFTVGLAGTAGAENLKWRRPLGTGKYEFADAPVIAEAVSAKNLAYYAPVYGSCTWDATHDVGACINAALAAAAAAGGGTVSLPPGTYGLSTKITWPLPAPVALRCPAGAGAGSATTLKWIGAAAGRMVEIRTSTGSVKNSELTGCNFDGNGGLAADGLYLSSVDHGHFDNLTFQGGFNGGNVVNATVDSPAPAEGTQNNTFDNLQIVNGVGGVWTSNQFRLGSYIRASDGVHGNAAFNLARNIVIGGNGGAGIICDGCDNNYISGRVFNAVKAIDLTIASAGSYLFPAQGNVFSPMMYSGPFTARGTTSFPACSGPTCTYANELLLDSTNGSPAPTIEAGASLTWGNNAGQKSRLALVPATVAGLGPCNATYKYVTAAVSDQSGVPTYRGALTGGGAIAVLAYCNGTSWEAH